MLCLVDGGYFMMKGIYDLPNPNKFHEGDLIEKMHEYMQELQKISNTISLCKDYKSWRRDIYPKYKEHRQDDKTKKKIDFNKVFKGYEEYLKHFTKAGGNVFVKTNVEADDLIYGFSVRSQTPVCIVSPDRDLTQLLTDKVIQVCHSTKKIFVEENTNFAFNSLDVLQNKDTTFLKIFNLYPNFEIVYVDVLALIIEKIIVGDKSDNIDSIITTTVNERNYRYPKKHIWKIINYIKTFGITVNDLLHEHVILELHKKCLEFNEMDFESSLNNLKLNIRLVLLHRENYPPNIYNDIISIPMEFTNVITFDPFKMDNTNDSKGFDIDKWGEFL